MNELESRVQFLETEVRTLRAVQDIRRVLSLYAIGVDDKRAEVLAPLFSQDAVISVPAWSIEVTGSVDIMAFFERYWSRFDNARRYYANEDIQVDGSAASAFMYWQVTQDLGSESVLGWGTYDWVFTREDDAWLIKHETVHIRAMTTLAAGWAGQHGPMQL
jgi:hypothetical protein